MKTLALMVISVGLLAACNRTAPVKTTAAETVNTDSLEHARAWYAPHHCYYTNLSHQFNLAVDAQRFPLENENDSTAVWLYIKNKTTNVTTDSFMVFSLYYYSTMFTNCDSVTSYATGYHANKTIVDNMFGDIVAADLNFDGLDDIAVIDDPGMSAGPVYSYFTQTQAGTFVRDAFLTDSVGYFTDDVDTVKHQRTTYIPAGAYGLGVHVYGFNKKTGKWKSVSHTVRTDENFALDTTQAKSTN